MFSADPTGVFAAYLDVNYPAALVSVDGPIVHSSVYDSGVSGSTTTSGLIDEVGGVDGITELGGGLYEVFRVAMRAGNTPGEVDFTSDAADDLVQHPVIIFGTAFSIDASLIDYGSTLLTVAAVGDDVRFPTGDAFQPGLVPTMSVDGVPADRLALGEAVRAGMTSRVVHHADVTTLTHSPNDPMRRFRRPSGDIWQAVIANDVAADDDKDQDGLSRSELNRLDLAFGTLGT